MDLAFFSPAQFLVSKLLFIMSDGNGHRKTLFTPEIKAVNCQGESAGVGERAMPPSKRLPPKILPSALHNVG